MQKWEEGGKGRGGQKTAKKGAEKAGKMKGSF